MTPADELTAQLRTQVAGPVLGPGDDDFATEVAAQNTAVLHVPDVAVGLTSEADAVAVVNAAAASGTPVRVLATGHGSATPVTGGILVTTSRLTGVTIDVENRVAHIAAGTRWREVIEAAAEHGLAPICGASDNVGTIGYIVGGGLGPLARTFGFSSDWARGFRVVTADGSVVSANATENPDLFWALRGGKGGFGIVTSMDFELVELSTLYGGSLFFDAEHIASVFTTWVEWTQTLPEEATSSVVILRLPPLPFIPEPLRGKTVLSLRFAYIGDQAEGERLLEPIRAVAPALIDAVAEMQAAQIATIHNDPTDPGPGWDRGMLLNQIDNDFAAALLEGVGPDKELPVVAIELRHLGGATKRDVPEGSAVGGRNADYTLIFIGVPDPSLFDTVLPKVVDGVLAPLAPWISPETNVNYAGGFFIPGSYDASWPADTLTRLNAVRATYDPNTVFPYGPPA
ncbi:MAG TPA: FAD-binding oxidoreductase [Kribbella sp.]|uniref:FAD-binding oxidoreductase n=1 Tax=Kribbella sp. TaxID=1871183 RepID=UPI002D78DA18|nr:FAD-binding oxidoreductase [Kribbella sp.]HET6295791.1 FAD-binding oxidoreductase [Kribbella sp.]